jgi:peptidylprolyl isomerase
MSRAPALCAVAFLLHACGRPPGETTTTEPAEVAPIAESEGDETPPGGDTEAGDAQAVAPAADAPPMSIEAPSDVSAPPPGAEVTPTGLASRVLRPGHGSAHPAASDQVTVHYVGWTTDGARFDSSVERGQPATFPLNGVIAGWTEGVQLMVEGERRRFWIPEALAYQGRPGRPAGMLVFDVELMRIER